MSYKKNIIIGIGLSSGGLDSLNRFFSSLKKPFSQTIIIYQSFSQNIDIITPQQVKEMTWLPVEQLHDGAEILPSTVYMVKPGDALLVSDKQYFETAADKDIKGIQGLDNFFSSLSESFCDRAAGILMSGMGCDGVMGLEKLRSRGGIVIVQDPESSKFRDMPENAVRNGVYDTILSPEMMPHYLADYTRYLGTPKPAIDTESVKAVINILHEKTGHDFSNYKINTITRRIKRQAALKKTSSIDEYIKLIKTDLPALDSLFKDFLIGVTGFFRDMDAFEEIERTAIQAIINRKDRDHIPIRIWIPGCATGEETYSIAVLFMKQMKLLKKNIPLQIFASDIDQASIETARKASYNKSSVDKIPAHILNEYFELKNGKYRPVKEIRECVIFSFHSVIKDPPFSRVDLISCRNVMIYLNSNIQKKVISIFHYALNPDGYLFLGTAESLGESSQMFSEIDKKNRIFQKINGAARGGFITRMPLNSTTFNRTIDSGISQQKENNVFGRFTENLMNAFAPPCVITDLKGEILDTYKNVDRYLDLTSDKGRNIFLSARDGLLKPLSNTIKKAVIDRNPAESEAIAFKNRSSVTSLRITVIPSASSPDLLLIAFQEIQTNDSRANPTIRLTLKPAEELYDGGIESELRHTKDFLEKVSRELDASNEELKSTNEELLASNEELHSSNEELQTSQEELQSMNEELLSLNTELNIKNQELINANSDLDNLLLSTRLAVIFVDEAMRITRFTPDAARVYNLINSDTGRPISHIVSNIEGYASQLADISTVISSHIPIEKEVSLRDGSCFWMRILPFVSVYNEYSGTLLTFHEITDIKKSSGDIIKSEMQYSILFESMRDGCVSYDLTGKILSANHSFCSMLGYTREQLESIPFNTITPAKWNPLDSNIINDQVIARGYSDLYEKEFISASGAEFPVEVRTYSVRNENGRLTGFWTVANDITHKKKFLSGLAESEEKFRILTESTSLGIMIYQDDRWVYTNPMSEKICGYTSAELRMMNFWDFVHPDYKDLVKKNGRSRQKGEGASSSYEFRIIHKSGKAKWVLLTGDTITFSGRPAGMISVLDISRIKETDSRFERERAILNSVIDHNPFAIIILDRDGRPLKTNTAFSDLFGRPVQQNISLFDSPFMKQSGFVEKAGNILAGETVYFNDTWFDPDSLSPGLPASRICIRSIAFPITGIEGTVDNIVIINENTTAVRIAETTLRESEERMRALIENAVDAIFVGDPQGNFINVNSKGCELTGYSRFELLAMNMRDLFTLNEMKINPLRYDLLQMGKAVLAERLLLRKNGSEIAIEMNTKKMADGTYQAIMRDTRDKKRIEAEREKNHRLESLGVLAGGIAHDFNNILASILGNITLAKLKSSMDDNIHSLLSEAERGGFRARDLTHQLLTFSRGGAPVKTNARIEDLIKDSAEFIIRGSSTSIDYFFDKKLMTVHVDSGQISQVIQNLIINAVQSMPKGGRIEISAMNHYTDGGDGHGLEEGHYVRIDVRDEGSGIESDVIKNIFDPYFTTKQSGSGLGLSICYSIIRRHDGNIEVESKPGRGTRFTFFLPATKSEPDAIQNDEAPSYPDRQLHILFMDDDAGLRKVAEKAVTGFGHKIDTAADGIQALKLYAASIKAGKPYDAVIMDLTVPGGMGGIDLIGELIILDPDVRAIVSSGYSNDPVMSEYAAYKFKGVIAKPFDLNLFMKTIYSVVKQGNL